MKMSLERKARDAELWAHRLMHETDCRSHDPYVCRALLYGSEGRWAQVYYAF